MKKIFMLTPDYTKRYNIGELITIFEGFFLRINNVVRNGDYVFVDMDNHSASDNYESAMQYAKMRLSTHELINKNWLILIDEKTKEELIKKSLKS